MSRLVLPPRVEQRLREETNAYTASVDSMVERMHGLMAHWNQLLEDIDPCLELIFLPPNADLVGAVPGRFHVMRVDPPSPPVFFVVEGPDGEFVEPHSGMLEELRRADMWDGRVMRDRAAAKARARYEKEQARQRAEDERRQEMQERWAAVTRTFVSMDRSSPWSQSHAGRRGARR